MPHLTYNAAARRELIAIAAYVSRVSGDAARGQNFAQRSTRHCEFLAGLQSVVGRPRPDLGRKLRSSVCGCHIIVFRYEDRSGPRSPMIVVHILNGRRDLTRVFLRSKSVH